MCMLHDNLITSLLIKFFALCFAVNVPVAGIVLGVVFGSLALVLVIVIIVVAVCMLVPSCFHSKKRKRSGYKEV